LERAAVWWADRVSHLNEKQVFADGLPVFLREFSNFIDNNFIPGLSPVKEHLLHGVQSS
jgi:hypothetical protein